MVVLGPCYTPACGILREREMRKVSRGIHTAGQKEKKKWHDERDIRAMRERSLMKTKKNIQVI